MTPEFVKQQIELDHVDALLVGSDWRIGPASVTNYLDSCQTMAPILRLVRD